VRAVESDAGQGCPWKRDWLRPEHSPENVRRPERRQNRSGRKYIRPGRPGDWFSTEDCGEFALGRRNRLDRKPNPASMDIPGPASLSTLRTLPWISQTPRSRREGLKLSLLFNPVQAEKLFPAVATPSRIGRARKRPQASSALSSEGRRQSSRRRRNH